MSAVATAPACETTPPTGLAVLRQAVHALVAPAGDDPVPTTPPPGASARSTGTARSAGSTGRHRAFDTIETLDLVTATTPVGPLAPPAPITPVPPADAVPPVRPVDADHDGGEVWDLVRRAQAGDVEAFGDLYERYLDMVFRYVYFRVGNRALAEDLTSETFLRALRRLGSLAFQGRDPGAWFVTIARNLVADHYKSGRTRLETTTGDLLDSDREDHGAESRPEATVLERMTNDELLGAVRRLGAEQQECIVLRFLQGLSVAETAAVMGKNDGAVKALQYRATRALGRLLPADFQP